MVTGNKTQLLPLAALVALCWVTTPVQGHGRMLIPLSRASAWRFDVPGAPIDYNDNQAYCGNFTVQHVINGGRCGICGDDWRQPQPRDHERPSGQFVMASDFILTTYKPGQVIEVNIQLTAVHKGYFQFKLCNVDSLKDADATQDCLDQHTLTGVGTTFTKYLVPDNAKSGDKYSVQLQLPAGLTCDFCVLQWKYHTGNSWDAGCLGCGNQEEFYSCADIRITSDPSRPPQVASLPTTTTTTARPSYYRPTTTVRPPYYNPTTPTTTTRRPYIRPTYAAWTPYYRATTTTTTPTTTRRTYTRPTYAAWTPYNRPTTTTTTATPTPTTRRTYTRSTYAAWTPYNRPTTTTPTTPTTLRTYTRPTYAAWTPYYRATTTTTPTTRRPYTRPTYTAWPIYYRPTTTTTTTTAWPSYHRPTTTTRRPYYRPTTTPTTPRPLYVAKIVDEFPLSEGDITTTTTTTTTTARPSYYRPTTTPTTPRPSYVAKIVDEYPLSEGDKRFFLCNFCRREVEGNGLISGGVGQYPAVCQNRRNYVPRMMCPR